MRTRVARASALVLLAAGTLLALPTVSLAASVWTEGTTSSPFSVSSQGGLLMLADSADPALTLPYEASVVWQAPDAGEVRSVRDCGDGSFLVSRSCGTDGVGGGVWRVRSNTDARPVLTSGQLGLGANDFRPFDAVKLADGMLVADRGATQQKTGRVIRLDSSNRVTWSYDYTAGTQLDPFSAEPVPGTSNTLIADSLGNRVIEVNSAGAIAWSCSGQLSKPHSAQRIGSGASATTLICDSENNRVLEVDRTGREVWRYGTGTKSSGPNELSGPNFARRLASGNTLICDANNGRVIEVDRSRNIVEAYGVAGRTPANGTIVDPRMAVRMADGTTVVGANGNRRLVRYGYHANREYTFTSAPIDPSGGRMKWFTKLAVSASRPAGTTVMAEYSVDGIHWNPVPSSGALPSTAKGSAIRYRVTLSTANAAHAPSLLGVSITWQTTAPTTTKTKKSNKSSKSTKAAKSSTTTSTASSSAKSSASGASRIGAGKVNSGGTGSTDTTTVAPGSGSSIGGGQGGNGGDGVQQTANMSGWVMSEVKDDVGGLAGSSGTGGFQESTLGKGSGTSSATLLLLAYSVGLVWSPAPKLLVRFVAALVTH